MNNRKTYLTTLLGGLLAIGAGASLAANPERDPGQQSAPTAGSRAQTGSSANTMSTTNTSTAQVGTSTAQEKFDALDVNHDGMIDKSEAKASNALSAEFKRLDADNDGKLSMTEFSGAKNLASIKVNNNKSKMDKSKSSGYR